MLVPLHYRIMQSPILEYGKEGTAEIFISFPNQPNPEVEILASLYLKADGTTKLIKEKAYLATQFGNVTTKEINACVTSWASVKHISKHYLNSTLHVKRDPTSFIVLYLKHNDDETPFPDPSQLLTHTVNQTPSGFFMFVFFIIKYKNG